MKGINSEIEEIIVQALAHEARRTMLRIINSNEKGATYSEMLLELGLSTGKLNYHLRQLEGLIEKNTERRYVFTPLGRRAMNFLYSITQNLNSDCAKYLKEAQLSQKTSLHPMVKSLIYFGIAWAVIILSIWGYLTYIFLIEDAPVFLYLLMPVLLVLGSAMLAWLIYALKRAPDILKRFEKRLFLFA